MSIYFLFSNRCHNAIVSSLYSQQLIVSVHKATDIMKDVLFDVTPNRARIGKKQYLKKKLHTLNHKMY